MLQPDVRIAARAARPERRSALCKQHKYVVEYFISLRNEDLCRRRIRWGERIGISREIPLFREVTRFNSPVIPLLFPLLIPLLFRRQHSEFIPQIPESAHVFETGFSQKTAESGFFPRQQGNLDFQQTRSLSTASRREAGCRERACSKNTHQARGRNARPRTRAGEGHDGRRT
jgi:hypothetical protein